MFIKGCTALILCIFFLGCSTKEYALFQDESVDKQISAKEESLLKYVFPPKDKAAQTCNIPVREEKLSFGYASKILPGDTLRIDFYNNSRKIALEDVDLSVSSLETSSVQSPVAKPQKEEYLVDVDGTVYLPLLHDTKLASMTEQEASSYLTEKYRSYLTNPKIKVHIGNTRIYVLGEVNKKGVLPVKPSGISLYEVIAKSGGMTDYAVRSAIKIISGPLGNQKMRFVDMTSMAALNGANLMIPPNSIVYVPPKGTKAVKVAIDDYMPLLQLLTTTMGTYLSIDYFINGRD